MFFPWQVIEVSPLGLRRLAGEKGLAVLQSELLWVWLPAALACVFLVLLRRLRPNRSSAPQAQRPPTTSGATLTQSGASYVLQR